MKNIALTPGRVYRTRELSQWSANAPRLAKRLVREGRLVPLEQQGLYACPQNSRFGTVPPSDGELMRAFLGGTDYVFTGSPQWNALGVGTTQVATMPLVYNTKRSGVFTLGGRRFELRRVAFPKRPAPEWFAVDLVENAGRASASGEDVVDACAVATRAGTFDATRLHAMATQYGTKRTLARFQQALGWQKD